MAIFRGVDGSSCVRVAWEINKSEESETASIDIFLKRIFGNNFKFKEKLHKLQKYKESVYILYPDSLAVNSLPHLIYHLLSRLSCPCCVVNISWKYSFKVSPMRSGLLRNRTRGNHIPRGWGSSRKFPKVVCVDSRNGGKFWGIYQGDYIEGNMGASCLSFTSSSGSSTKQIPWYNLPFG